MKKILTVSLALCLLFALVASFAINTMAEEIDVSVGTRFEWNEQSGDAEKAWRTSKGKSPDGLWKYQYYALKRGIYMDLNVFTTSNFFAWTASPGNDGLGWVRVYDKGYKFHPGELADVVKTFTCPSGGTVTVETTVNRQHEWTTGSNTPSSFAVYVESSEGERLVYPTDGSEYLTITSTTEQNISFDVEVKKNELIHFRVGAMENQSGDAVFMSNFVTYKSVSDDVSDEVVDQTITIPVSTVTNNLDLTVSDIVIDQEIADKVQSEKEEAAKTSSKKDTAKDDEGSSIGLIIGVVAAVVVVAGVAAAVIVVKKKK